MSGTSADAVTAAAVRLNGVDEQTRIEVVGFQEFPLPKELASRARRPERLAAADVAVLNMRFGELFAQAALTLMRALCLAQTDVDAIASHGQTLAHRPDQRGTLQVGEPSVIAERTGIMTVAEFRYRDIAAGGQGAPLVPLADYMLFSSTSVSRAVQNIGGIANVTWLPKAGSLDDVIAFDTGPGNMVIDAAMQIGSRFRFNMDTHGQIAASGPVNQKLLEKLLQNDYFQRPPPKSAGREEFGYYYAKEVLALFRHRDLNYRDAIPTITALTATSIAHAYRTHLPRMPEEVIVGGGGTRNPTLMRMLHERLPECRLHTHEDFGIPDKAKEAIAFCILANQTLLGRPGNVPSATGASHAAPLGKVVFP